MIVVDPGHEYLLEHLDGNNHSVLRFVKRVGDNYRPNVAPAREGPTTQEVIRALIHRMEYVQMQKHDDMNRCVLSNLRGALLALEARAAALRGVEQVAAFHEMIDERMHCIENEPTCKRCGHVRCIAHLEVPDLRQDSQYGLSGTTDER